MTPAAARKLTAFGLVTVGDLIDHFPRRYEDFRDRKQIRDLKVGEEATVRATVVRVTAERTARGGSTSSRSCCATTPARIEAVWFNQRYLTKVLAEDMQLSVRGMFRQQGGRASFVVKSHEILDEEGAETRAHGGHRARVPGERAGVGAALAGRPAGGPPGRCGAFRTRCRPPLACERGSAGARRRHAGRASAARASPRPRPRAPALCWRSCCSCRWACCCTKASSSAASRRRRCRHPASSAGPSSTSFRSSSPPPARGARRARRRPYRRRRRCAGCCRATWDPARRSSPCTACCAP